MLEAVSNDINVLQYASKTLQADPEFQDPSLPPTGGGIQSSDFNELLEKIGVSINPSKILLDRKYAIPVTSATSDRPIKHAAILSFPKKSFNKNLNITNKLNSLTSAFSGSIENTNMSNKFTSLISSSDDSSVTEKNVFRYLPDPSILLEKYKPTPETEIFAGLIENENKQILFIYRLKKWDLPKGKKDKGESIMDCASIEVEEETKVKVKCFKKIIYLFILWFSW